MYCIVLRLSSLSCVGGVCGAHENPGCKNGEKLWLAIDRLGIVVQELHEAGDVQLTKQEIQSTQVQYQRQAGNDTGR